MMRLMLLLLMDMFAVQAHSFTKTVRTLPQLLLHAHMQLVLHMNTYNLGKQQTRPPLLTRLFVLQLAKRQMLYTAGQGISTIKDVGLQPPLGCPQINPSSMGPSAGNNDPLDSCNQRWQHSPDPYIAHYISRLQKQTCQAAVVCQKSCKWERVDTCVCHMSKGLPSFFPSHVTFTLATTSMSCFGGTGMVLMHWCLIVLSILCCSSCVTPLHVVHVSYCFPHSSDPQQFTVEVQLHMRNRITLPQDHRVYLEL